MGQTLCSFHDGHEFQCEKEGEIKCDRCGNQNKWCSKHIFHCSFYNKSICPYCVSKTNELPSFPHIRRSIIYCGNCEKVLQNKK